jgi:predicted nucleotidyltransferase
MLLRIKDKQRLLNIFSSVEIPFEIWAYGSRVNGTAHDGSDLDLVIRSPKLNPLPTELYNELCEKIRDSNIPILVELRDWALLPESFHKNIEQQYEVLFSNVEVLVNEPPSAYQASQGEKEK